LSASPAASSASSCLISATSVRPVTLPPPDGSAKGSADSR
jgi:hypothetical protein